MQLLPGKHDGGQEKEGKKWQVSGCHWSNPTGSPKPGGPDGRNCSPADIEWIRGAWRMELEEERN